MCPGSSFVRSLQGTLTQSRGLVVLSPFTCTDGTVRGNDIATIFSWTADTSTTGFTGARIYWNGGTTNQITGFGLIRGDGSTATFHGTTTASNNATLQCPSPGMVVAGFDGWQAEDSEQNFIGLNRVGLVCRRGVFRRRMGGGRRQWAETTVDMLTMM